MLDSGVQAVIGSRFYPVILPENPAYPCASYQDITTKPQYTLDGPTPAFEVRRLQIDTWSGGSSNASFADAKTAQAAIRAVLEGFAGTLPGGVIVAKIFVITARSEYEQDARCFRTTTEFMIHFYPPG